MKEERFPHPGSLLHQLGSQLGQRGNFRSLEKSAAAGLERAGQVVLATLLHLPAPDTCLLVCVVPGC